MHLYFYLQAAIVVSSLLIWHKIYQYKVLFLFACNHSSFLIILPFISIAQQVVHIAKCSFNSAKTVQLYLRMKVMEKCVKRN